MATPDRHARLKIGVAFPEFRVEVKEQGLAVDPAAEALADPGKRLAAVGIATLHANARDQNPLDRLLLDLKRCLGHDTPRFLFLGEERVQGTHDIPIAPDL